MDKKQIMTEINEIEKQISIMIDDHNLKGLVLLFKDCEGYPGFKIGRNIDFPKDKITYDQAVMSYTFIFCQEKVSKLPKDTLDFFLNAFGRMALVVNAIADHYKITGKTLDPADFIATLMIEKLEDIIKQLNETKH
jgi:hypothetical protein